MLTVVENEAREEAACNLDELAREGARRMLQSGLAEEVAAYIERHQEQLDERGHRLESAFATVRLRQRVTKGAGNRTKGLMMSFKLLAMAQVRWRKLNGAHLLPLVRAGVEFEDGRPVERNESDQEEAA